MLTLQIVHFRHFTALRWQQLAVLTFCLLLPGGFASADEVLMKDGTLIEGTAVKVPGLTASMVNRNSKGNVRIDQFWMIDDDVRRYFVGRLRVEDVLEDDDLARQITFELEHERSSRIAGPAIVGGFSQVEKFDEFGRRTVFLTVNKKRTPIIQGITELRPNAFKVDSLTHQWEYFLDTKTLKPDVLLSLIEQASDRSDPNERKAAVVFFVQANMLKQAELELDRISEEFPELKDWAEDYRSQIFEARARESFHEIDSRRKAGQHKLAMAFAKATPVDKVSGTLFRTSREILDEYQDALQKRDEAILMLDMLQATIDPKQADKLRSLRAKLLDELTFDSIDRLNPFLRSKIDESLIADQKLALAYSGWVLGEANAVLDLKEAISLWEGRFLVLEILRNEDNPFRDDELLEQLTELEYIGIERIVQMIPLLPPPEMGPVLAPGHIDHRVVPVKSDEAPTSYSVMLPPGYSPYREYPLLVALRSRGRSEDQTLNWWGGDQQREGWAQRRGYIVIAPKYCDENATSYGGNTTAHEVVTKSIEDVRKRYRVDSDRVFLAGHGMGGDACFDIGMSRPDWFAGVIPIAGECGKICNYYWENGPDLNWYLVAGDRDRNTVESNASLLNTMIRNRQNVIVCIYKDRGFESYYEEQEKLFAWMQLHQRPALSDVKEFEAGTMRSSENAFHWLEAKRLRSDLFPVDIFSQRKAKSIFGKATPGNVVYVQVPGSGATVWLSPELVDFEKRIQFRFNMKRTPNDFIQPSIKTLLTRLRDTGDRKRLYWAKVDL